MLPPAREQELQRRFEELRKHVNDLSRQNQ
jgi:hypothetical protein